MSDTRPRRSALYVPGSNAKALAKAATLGCDVVIIDLEDAVAPDVKEVARAEAVAAAYRGVGDKQLIVRVNGLGTPWGKDDLAAVSAAPIDGILIPKIDGAEDIARYASGCGDKTLWVMVETARAMFRLEEIASSAGVSVLVMGTNDLAKEMRAKLTAGRDGFVGFLSQTVAAARAHGVGVLDGVCNEFTQLELFSDECLQGAALGFDGKTLIHPNQIAPCNDAFSPSPSEIASAESIVRAFSLPENADKGALKVDGKMFERLHLAQANELLEVAQLVAAR